MPNQKKQVTVVFTYIQGRYTASGDPVVESNVFVVKTVYPQSTITTIFQGGWTLDLPTKTLYIPPSAIIGAEVEKGQD